MANQRLSKENLTNIRRKIQQRRKERKAAASGTTDISINGSAVDVTYWYAFVYYEELWVNATVTGKTENLSTCEIFLTPLGGGPRSADGFVLGSDLGRSFDIGALTELVTARPDMVHSEITGTTASGTLFQYQADLYTYDLQ